MLLLSIGLIMGLILAPYGKNIGQLLGDTKVNSSGILFIVNNVSTTDQEKLSYQSDPSVEATASYYWAIVFTVLGTILLDFNADNCQTPARAYLLDMIVQEDQGKALSTFTIMAGIGGSLGYALGAINWDETIFADLIGDNIKTVFALVTVIFICSMICTITSFREIPLELMEADELLKPLTQAEVKKEKEKLKSSANTMKGLTNSLTSLATATTDALAGNGTLISNGKDMNFLTEPMNGQIVKNNSNDVNIVMDAKNGDAKEIINCDANHNGIPSSESDDDDEDDDEHRVSLIQYLKSIVIMPASIRILCLTNLLCWMSHLCYCLYFTDFVGEAVFHGDPAAPVDSPEYILYDQGIRFGCWGMAIYALSCAIYSMVIERLIKRFKAKKVFVGGLAIFGIGMGLLGAYPTKWGVLVFSITAGIVYATLFTMPYLLVANYHGKGSVRIFHIFNRPLETVHKLRHARVFLLRLCENTIQIPLQNRKRV